VALPPELGPHTWTATIKVIGEDGNPIFGADVAVSYTLPPPPGRNLEAGPDWSQVKGLTDANGVFSATHTDSSLDLAVIVNKSGYYTTQIGHQFYYDEKRRHPSFTLLLKKIGQPIAMYARRLNTHVPALDTRRPAIPPLWNAPGRPSWSRCRAEAIVVNLPSQEFGLVGRIANLTWKFCMQKAILRRKQPETGFLRPVAIFADEAQMFISKFDSEYQSVARSAGGATVYLTQNIESFRRVLKNNDAVDSLLGNLQALFFAPTRVLRTSGQAS
jgi:hypothetical protein